MSTNPMINYRIFMIAFIIQALVFATISTLSIETRVGIFSNKQKPFIEKKHLGFYNLYRRFFYTLRIIPYEVSKKLGILSKEGQVHEVVKMIYTFIISFCISILVYHIFLMLLGYNQIYKYYFGNIKLNQKLKNRKPDIKLN